MQKIHSSVSEKISKKTIFDTQFPANQWITFLENGHLGQMLYSVGLYHHANKFIAAFWRKCQKHDFLTLNNLLIPKLFSFKPET